MTTVTVNQRPATPDPDDGEPRSVVVMTLSPTPWWPASPASDEPPAST
jgi:hypothetical protein